ncbi:MAG: DoxX family membrane protein [Candidatus Competibacterales bacterium]
MIGGLNGLYNSFFGVIEQLLGDWFLGLSARLVFAGVLFFYYFNSALTKVGEGVAGFFVVQDGAYFQIVPPIVEAFDYDATQVPFIPYGLIVYLGTYSEFVLPVLVVVGLFTRVAAAGMIGFIVVQSYVDMAYHGVDTETIVTWFDRVSDAAIFDQRAFWVFLLLYLVLKGPGIISLDGLLGRRRDSVEDVA